MTKLIVAFRSFANKLTKYVNMSNCDNNVLILVGWPKQKFFHNSPSERNCGGAADFAVNRNVEYGLPYNSRHK